MYPSHPSIDLLIAEQRRQDLKKSCRARPRRRDRRRLAWLRRRPARADSDARPLLVEPVEPVEPSTVS